MKDKFIKTYRYTKGIYEANVYSLANRDLLYHDSKLTDANIASSVNTGEILAGLGNAPQIMIFDTAKFSVTMTAQDIDLRQYALQTGGSLGYNGITQTCEIITADGSGLTLGSTPSAPYGSDQVVCYINGDGTAYKVDPVSKEVQGFVATPGEQYSVRYYISKPANEVLDVQALFAPEIVALEIKYPVYQAPVGQAASAGTLCGNQWAIIPRYQFNGEASFNATQTGNVTPSLSGQALAADELSETDCAASALSSLLYLVWEPSNADSGIQDLVVVGGGVSVAVDGTAIVPVKYLMEGGILAQPDFSALTYTSGSDTTATVTETGVITGKQAGDTDITVKYEPLGLKTVVPVSVS